MNNIASYLLANLYSSFSPTLNATAAVCMANGQEVPCPAFLNILGPAFPIIILAIFVILIAAGWKIFTKAGQPGWAAIIPIYNIIVMLKIVKKPIWWVILAFIPIVNIVISVIVAVDLAKAFGKSIGFAIGIIVVPIIFYPILGFGKAVYRPATI
jgi:hypothetical protein